LLDHRALPLPVLDASFWRANNFRPSVYAAAIPAAAEEKGKGPGTEYSTSLLHAVKTNASGGGGGRLRAEDEREEKGGKKNPVVFQI